MIIVFKRNSNPQAKLKLKQDLESRGFTIHASDGLNASLFGIVGDTTNLDINEFYKYDFVEKVMRVTEPFRGGFRPEKGLIEWANVSVAIVGLGLMGGSYAKAFRRLGVGQIIGVGRSSKTLLEARQMGIIDIAMVGAGPALKRADIVILAVYPEAMVECTRQMLPYLKEKAIITDIAGIKGNMIQEIQSLLPEGMEFISGHPMAGRQASGLAMSDASIFYNANYIIVPTEKNTAQGVSWLETMARDLGFGHTVRVTPEEHDRTIAYTSDLTHILAVSLVNSASFNEKTKYFVAGSYRDGSRVADINPELWCDLFLANREKVADEIDKYMDQLEQWRQALRSSDAETMKEMMRQSTVRRRSVY